MPNPRNKYPSYDVVVCGAGCAGLAAAISAARSGAKVLLLERAGFSGGILTAVGLNYFDGIVDAVTDKIILRGISKEFLVRLGVCSKEATHLDEVDPNRAVYGHGAITIRNVEEFKVLADKFITQEPNLHVLYHTSMCAVDSDSDGRISGVHVANKDGLGFIPGKVFIDATGDADVVRFMGLSTLRSKVIMPMTLHFRIGNVVNTPTLKRSAREVLTRASQKGQINSFYGPFMSFSFADNEINVHAIRVPGDASSASDLTRSEIQARSDAWTIYGLWKDNLEEFKNAYYVTSGPYLGVRETHRIIGRDVLEESDILENREYADAVATGTWYMDVHPNELTVGSANKKSPVWPGTYHIRYGTLLPESTSNLLVAGRCHSATQLAASSSRVTCTAMDMGQAAGIAAAFAIKSNRQPSDLSGESVREQMDVLECGPL